MILTDTINLITNILHFISVRVSVGIFCTTPGVALARAVPRKVALEMLFSGHPISAQGRYINGGN